MNVIRKIEDHTDYEPLFENSAEGMLVCEAGKEAPGRILRANAEACRITGRKHAALVGSRFGQIFDVSDPRLKAARREQRRTGKFEGELRLWQPDGEGTTATVSMFALGENREGIILRNPPAAWQEIQRLQKDLEARSAQLAAAMSETDDYEAMMCETTGRLRAVFEQVAVGMALIELDGRWVLINDKLCDILGYSSEELRERTFQDISHPEDLDTELRYMELLLAGETQTYSMEKRCFRKDGSIVWVNLTVSLVRETSGEPQYFISVVEDITRDKEVERTLARLASYPVQNPNPIIEVSVSGEITYLNPAGEKSFPDLRELGAAHPLLADLDEVMREIRNSGGRSQLHEVRVDKRFYQRMVYPAPESGLVRIYATDITESRRAEETLRNREQRFGTLVQNASDIVTVLEADGTIRYESPAIESVLGYKAEEITGTNISDYVHPEDLKDVKDSLATLAGQPEMRLRLEFRRRNADGSWRYLESIATNLLEDPIVQGIVVNSRDITDRRQAERALRERERLYRAVVEHAAENIFLVDVETKRILDSNAVLQKTLEYSEEELKHMTLYDIVAHDRESVDQNIQRILEDGTHYLGQRNYRRKDGSFLEVEVSVSTVPYRDRQAMCIVAHDVTQRNQVESQLRQSLAMMLALREAGQTLGSTLESEEVVSRLLELMQRVSSLTAAIISLKQEDGSLRIWRSVGLRGLWRRARFTPEAETARRAALENEEQRLFKMPPPEDTDAGHLVGLCLPLRVQDRAVGVLEAYGPESFVEGDTVELIASITSQAAHALENARLYEELGERERQLQDLVGKLLGAQEEERRRVAYEVHDGLAQVAAAAHQRLEAFFWHHTLDTPKSHEDLRRVSKLVRQTVTEARRIIANLRPTALDDFGLGPTIRLEVERLRDEGYQVIYEEELGEERLPATVEIALFRAAQEALTNMRKHARTSLIQIRLWRQNNHVYLKVQDWGRGFDPDAVRTGVGPGEKVGLAGMRERITMLRGKLDIRSEPGAGTCVAIEVPLPATNQESSVASDHT